jgi:hypothetical protein
MPGPWEAWKSKNSFPTPPTVPWKSRRKREIPTFPQPGFAAMEKWKTKTGFSTFPPAARNDGPCSLSEKAKNQRKEAGRYEAFSIPRFRSYRSGRTE